MISKSPLRKKRAFFIAANSRWCDPNPVLAAQGDDARCLSFRRRPTWQAQVSWQMPIGDCGKNQSAAAREETLRMFAKLCMRAETQAGSKDRLAKKCDAHHILENDCYTSLSAGSRTSLGLYVPISGKCRAQLTDSHRASDEVGDTFATMLNA